MIKIYTNQSLLNEKSYTNYLFPLLPFLQNANSMLSQKYELVTTWHESNLAVFPVAIEYIYKLKKQKLVLDFIKEATINNKKVFLFTSGDIGLTIKNKNVFMLRLGGFNSKMTTLDFVMPPFIEDPYLFLNKKINFLTKTKLPTVGFVGHANGSLIKIIKEYLLFLRVNCKRIFIIEPLDYQPFYPSSFFRKKYLKIIKQSNLIKSNFIFRKKYRAGAKSKFDREKTTVEFYNNIESNGYTFCLRGGGNFSVRLYETLAMGRIPIVINTDCRLPFHDTINWNKHCLIIEQTDSQNMVNQILNFHTAISEEDFITIQKENRLLWEKYFTKENFFFNLEPLIQDIL